MSLYARKLARELVAQKGLTLTVLLVTSLGVMLFVTSAAGYLDLSSSYLDTRTRLRLASLHVDVSGLGAGSLAEVRALPGVAEAEARVVTAVGVAMPRGEGDEVELRLLSLPAGAQPRLDQVLVLSGRLPAGDDEVLVEKHLAEHHRLAAGDALEVRGAGAARRLRVTGVAVSAEYLWVARDAQEVFPSPASFGVGWMSRGGLRSLARAVVEAAAPGGPASPGLALAAGEAVGNQLLLQLRPGASAASVEDGLHGLLGAGKVQAVVQADQLVGVRLLQMDVDGYQGLAAFFPMFFLGVGAFILASVVGRLVDAQRPVIGTLLALGVSRSRVLGHYLAHAAVLGAAGSLLGAAGGLLAGRAVTHEYAAELGIPFVTARLHWDLAAWGVVGGLLVAVLAGALPAWRASRLPPAEAMRPPRPRLGPLARLARRVPAPLPVRLAVRDLLGAPLRSLGTVAGISAALVLVLVAGVMLDSMRQVVRVLFEDAQRYDLRVDLLAPRPLGELRSRLAAVAGVSAVEGLLALPVQLAAHGHQGAALLQGLPPGGRLTRSLDADGTPVSPGAGGVVLTRHLARALGVGPGDPVEVRPSYPAPPFCLTVSGLADGALGPVASARRPDLQAALGLGEAATSAVLAVAPAQLARVRRSLAAMPEVARVEDLASTRDTVDQVMGLGWAMLGTMLLFSAVLAAAILFNTATLNILERGRELATMRAMGRSQAELGWALTLEHGLLALAGLGVGIPLALAASARVLVLYSGELFVLPFVVSPRTLGVSAMGVVLTLLLAQWPALRAAARLPLAEAVRTRQ